jgi:hypothetical protein
MTTQAPTPTPALTGEARDFHLLTKEYEPLGRTWTLIQGAIEATEVMGI